MIDDDQYGGIVKLRILCAFVVSTMLCACLLPAEQANIAPEMQIHFLDVGQGDASLLRVGNSFALIDAGPENMGIVQRLRSLGVDTLDWILLTHGHNDHYGGLWEIFHRFTVRQLFLARDSAALPMVDSIGQVALKRGVPIDTLVRGDTLPISQPWKARVLWPPSTQVRTGNAASVIVLVEDEVSSVLWMGDAGIEEEMELVQREPDLRADILKVGHHGSEGSSHLEFLGALGLTWAVLSVGDNDWGHPRPATIERLRLAGGTRLQLWRTDQQGELCLNMIAGMGIQSRVIPAN